MINTKWNGGIHDRQLKEQICEIGRRVYDRGFAAANDGNISIRVGKNEVLCTPTMICKGFMTPDDICAVDLDGIGWILFGYPDTNGYGTLRGHPQN